MADDAPLIHYQCDNPGCEMRRTSRTNLAVYGTCKECGTGVMRRKVPETSLMRCACGIRGPHPVCADL